MGPSSKVHRQARGAPPFSPLGFRLFAAYLKPYFRRSFHAVRTSGQLPPLTRQPEKPLIVYANHPSWWDPIHFALLARAKAPERKVYGPMEAKALEKYAFMGRLGVFGVERTYRGAKAFLESSSAVLAQPRAGLWLTAGGRFEDPRQRPALLPGLAHLLRHLDRAWVVPLAVEYPFWDERRPEALSRFGQAIDLAQEPERSAREWSALLMERLERTMDHLKSDALKREPKRFEALLEGRTGISLAYDGWRRLKALGHGRGFTGAHGGGEP